jgi:hypothetical protein
MCDGPKTRTTSDHADLTRAGCETGTLFEKLFLKEANAYLKFWYESVRMWESLNADDVRDVISASAPEGGRSTN